MLNARVKKITKTGLHLPKLLEKDCLSCMFERPTVHNWDDIKIQHSCCNNNMHLTNMITLAIQHDNFSVSLQTISLGK